VAQATNQWRDTAATRLSMWSRRFSLVSMLWEESGRRQREPWRGTEPKGEWESRNAGNSSTNSPTHIRSKALKVTERNTMKATAAEMQYGCKWGVNLRRVWTALRGRVFRCCKNLFLPGRGTRKRSEPVPEWVAIYSSATCGVNRRGEEESRGRNRTDSLVAVRRRKLATASGS